MTSVRGAIAPTVGGALLHAGLQITFRDVPVRQWYAVPIYCIVSAGVASGYDNVHGDALDIFIPTGLITYAELARVSIEIAAKDVSRTIGIDWYRPYYIAARREHLSVYMASVSPDPHRTPTRGEFVQTLLEAIGVPLDAGQSIYSDVPASHPYAPAIAKATQLGIISGDAGKSTFRPDAFMNRAESAKILMLTMELPQLQELYLRRAAP